MNSFSLAALLLLAAPSAFAQTQPPSSPDLLGNWKVVGWTLPGSIPVRGYIPALKFSGAGQSWKMVGKVGCNFINGPATLKNDQLTFGVLVSTRVACSVAVGQQETALLKALSGQTLTAVRVADSLTLITKDGSELNIRRTTLQEK